MKAAVMQPYFFPYLGYYQLAAAVDTFVFFDDVAFIKKGFLNRNSIVLNKSKYLFSLPVTKASQNRAINEHFYTGEFDDFLSTIEHAYKNAPYYNPIRDLITGVLYQGSLNVAEINSRSIIAVFDYLEINKNFLYSSKITHDRHKKGKYRIIDICHSLEAEEYVNAAGGVALYNKHEFSEERISLHFIQNKEPVYKQNSVEHIPSLSIIDILMNCGKSEIIRLLQGYSIE